MSVNIQVLIPTALRRHTSGVDKLACSVATLPDLLDRLETDFPELKTRLRDETGTLRRFLNIYVNGEDIRYLGGPTYQFQDGDEIMLIPSIAGGSE